MLKIYLATIVNLDLYGDFFYLAFKEHVCSLEKWAKNKRPILSKVAYSGHHMGTRLAKVESHLITEACVCVCVCVGGLRKAVESNVDVSA